MSLFGSRNSTGGVSVSAPLDGDRPIAPPWHACGFTPSSRRGVSTSGQRCRSGSLRNVTWLIRRSRLRFESNVYRDLVVYTQASGAEVFAYQDNNGAEIDAVLVRAGAWAAMRAKPESLTSVTATGPSYTRPDGVNVISIPNLVP